MTKKKVAKKSVKTISEHEKKYRRRPQGGHSPYPFDGAMFYIPTKGRGVHVATRAVGETITSLNSTSQHQTIAYLSNCGYIFDTSGRGYRLNSNPSVDLLRELGVCPRCGGLEAALQALLAVKESMYFSLRDQQDREREAPKRTTGLIARLLGN